MPIIPTVRPLKSVFLNFRHQQWYNATKNQNKLVRMNIEKHSRVPVLFSPTRVFPPRDSCPIYDLVLNTNTNLSLPNFAREKTHALESGEGNCIRDISSAKIKISEGPVGRSSRFCEAWDWLQRGEMHRGLDLAQRQGMGETVW